MENLKISLSPAPLLDTLASLWAQLRASVLVPLTDTEGAAPPLNRQAQFHGWLRGDTAVVRNAGSHYADGAPGYITRNGLGSLDVGAAVERE